MVVSVDVSERGGRSLAGLALVVSRPRWLGGTSSTTSSDIQASRWNGTVVTLAWGSLDTWAWMSSAVRSWRMRCHRPLYLRSGSSTDTSVSPSDSS